MRFGMNELKSDNFYQNSMENLPGEISRKSLEGFFPETVNYTLPRAGYPAVPESRGYVGVGPT